MVQLITKELVISHSVKASEMQEIKVFQRILVSTNEADWKKQGMKMYSRGYFEQAMKCFERSGNRELYNKALANKSADSATRKLIEVESERSNIKQGLHVYEKITSSDLAKLKKKLKADEKSAYE